MEKFVYIGCTLGLTIYGQLIVKTRALVHAGSSSGGGKLAYLAAMFTDIAVLSGFVAAGVAGVFWALTVENTGLGFAYPFMALSFVLVPVAAALLFHETVTPIQLFGLSLIVIGVTINALAQ